jgi:hypothetical protein
MQLCVVICHCVLRPYQVVAARYRMVFDENGPWERYLNAITVLQATLEGGRTTQKNRRRMDMRVEDTVFGVGVDVDGLIPLDDFAAAAEELSVRMPMIGNDDDDDDASDDDNGDVGMMMAVVMMRSSSPRRRTTPHRPRPRRLRRLTPSRWTAVTTRARRRRGDGGECQLIRATIATSSGGGDTCNIVTHMHDTMCGCGDTDADDDDNADDDDDDDDTDDDGDADRYIYHNRVIIRNWIFIESSSSGCVYCSQVNAIGVELDAFLKDLICFYLCG